MVEALHPPFIKLKCQSPSHPLASAAAFWGRERDFILKGLSHFSALKGGTLLRFSMRSPILPPASGFIHLRTFSSLSLPREEERRWGPGGGSNLLLSGLRPQETVALEEKTGL